MNQSAGVNLLQANAQQLQQKSPGAEADSLQLTKGLKRIIVCVIDSGVDYNHPDLQGHIWTNLGEIPGNGIDDDSNGFVDDYYGLNVLKNNGDVMDGRKLCLVVSLDTPLVSLEVSLPATALEPEFVLLAVKQLTLQIFQMSRISPLLRGVTQYMVSAQTIQEKHLTFYKICPCRRLPWDSFERNRRGADK